jgi:hypothetical protein
MAVSYNGLSSAANMLANLYSSGRAVSDWKRNREFSDLDLEKYLALKEAGFFKANADNMTSSANVSHQSNLGQLDPYTKNTDYTGQTTARMISNLRGGDALAQSQMTQNSLTRDNAYTNAYQYQLDMQLANQAMETLANRLAFGDAAKAHRLSAHINARYPNIANMTADEISAAFANDPQIRQIMGSSNFDLVFGLPEEQIPDNISQVIDLIDSKLGGGVTYVGVRPGSTIPR